MKHVVVDNSTHKALKVFAAQRHITVKDLIRMLVEESIGITEE